MVDAPSGGLDEVKDVVQDAWFRLGGADRWEIGRVAVRPVVPPSPLAPETPRLARALREAGFGPALALAEEAIRLGDRGEAVPGEVRDQAARCEPEAPVTTTSAINAWNRISVTTRMVHESFRNQNG